MSSGNCLQTPICAAGSGCVDAAENSDEPTDESRGTQQRYRPHPAHPTWPVAVDGPCGVDPQMVRAAATSPVVTASS